jgi:hypothetical protein
MAISIQATGNFTRGLKDLKEGYVPSTVTCVEVMEHVNYRIRDN